MRLILFLAVGLTATCAQAAEPRFEDFPATATSGQVLARVIPPTDGEYSPLLERAIGRNADFAGTYVLAIDGCGTGCQQIAAIDVETGQAFVPGDGGSRNGACYRRDSRLLVVNPIAPDIEQKPDGMTTDFYVITDEGFHLVERSTNGTTLSCDTL